MEHAKIKVSGVHAVPVCLKDIPRGIKGATVRFEYADPLWDGLSKTVVFMGSGVTKDILDAGEVVQVPPEVVERAGQSLLVGVYGTDADGNKAIPTLWADLGRVRAAADPSGDESTDERLPVWAQLQKQIDEIRGTGTGGGYYTPAVTQPTEDTIQFDFTPSKAGMPAVEPVQVKLPAGSDSGGNVDLSGYLKLPTNEDGTPNNGTAGYYAVSDGNGGVTWVAAGNSGGGDSGGDTPVVPGSHGIIWDLVNVTSSSAVTSVSDGASLVAVLTPADGYTLGDVIVTMGGEALTGVWNADTQTVTIPSVTGDVIISCAGVEQTETTETLTDIRHTYSGWPTVTDNGDGTWAFDWSSNDFRDEPDEGNTHTYFSVAYPGEISGGLLTIKFNKPVISGNIAVRVFAVNKACTITTNSTIINNLKWSGNPTSGGVAQISADATLQMPVGMYPLVLVRDGGIMMEGDEKSSAYNKAVHVENGDISFTVTDPEAVNALTVDEDYAQDYGIAETSLVTNDAPFTQSGVNADFAAVIEEAKNAWMLEANGDTDKIPLIIHTDQHGYLTASPLFTYISEIVSWYEISKVVNLGDTANVWIDADTEHPLTECTALEDYLIAMKNVPYSKRIEIFGNHDTWDDTSGTRVGATPQNYLHKYFKNIYARRKDNYGSFVVTDDNYNVKYLTVSGFAYDSELGGYSHYVIPSDSIDWIISELEKADGYDVVILSHVPLSHVNAVSLNDLWSARRAKTSGSVTDEYGISHAFDFTACDGELLCGLHGHNHEDGHEYIGELLDVWFDALYIAPNAFHFVLVDRANRQLNVWKVDNTPQFENYQIPFDKPTE